MRILQIIEASSAGVGRHVLDICSALLDRGHEVHLLYSHVRSDRAFRERLVSISGPGFHASKLAMRRVPHWTDLAAIARIRAYARTHGPFDAVHMHSSKAGIVGRLGLVGSRARRIYTPHALYTMGAKGAALAVASAGEGMLARLCDTVILVSRAEFDHAVTIGLPPERLRVIHPGIASAPATPVANHTPDIRIGFVGRLVSQKSPENLMHTLRILVKEMSRPARLRIAGDGPLLPALTKLAQDSGIADRVDWLGPDDGAASMRSFDIFALASRYEGFPYVLLEAMNQGLPIVATCVGGTAEAIREDTGIVVPVGEPRAMARALAELIDDPARRQRMGARAPERVKRFSLDRMIEETLAVYRDNARARDVAPRPEMEEHARVRG